MKARQHSVVMTMIGSGLIIMSCLLPGMIPLGPVRAVSAPIIEQNVNTLIETLNGVDWVPLDLLAEEQYTEADLAKPGTFTFTINITDDTRTYFSMTDDTSTYFYYNWCTTTQEILRQNFEHISVKLYFNDEELGGDVVHPIAFTDYDLSTVKNLVCVEFGVMMSEWPNGKYTLKAVSTFNEKVNDGLADYEAGDRIYIYNVTVEK
jgi:hypothetical protein